jgi:hypothetical protein
MQNSPITMYLAKLSGAYAVYLYKYTVIVTFDGIFIHRLLI